MSNEQTPSIPLMSPEKARDIARGLKWLHEQYTEARMPREAGNALRDSEWWLAYALTLSQTNERGR